MKAQSSVFALASVALLLAAPAMGQVLNHPVQALPQGPSEGSTFLALQWGRGLNEDSGKANSFLFAGGRAMEKVSFSIAGGYALDVPVPDNNEFSLAGNLAYHFLSDDSTPVQVSGQVGIGWASLSETVATAAGDRSYMSFPVGIAISGRGSDSGSSVRPWIMPRLDIVRMSDSLDSSTSTNFGTSAGVSFTSEGGAGLHVSVDWVSGEDPPGSPFRLGVGAHYVIG